MKFYCLVVILLCSVSSIGQIDDSDQKKIEKILKGTELMKVNASNQIVDSTVLNGYFNGQNFSSNLPTKPDLIYISKKPVSLYEFEQFRQHVIDSMFRDCLYFCLESDEEASLLLQFDDRFFNEESLEMQDFDPSKRNFNREYFPLDYSRRMKYEYPSNKPCLAHFYNNPTNGFYRSKELNEKLFMYRYYYIKSKMNEAGAWNKKLVKDSSSIQLDLTTWQQSSQHSHDVYAVLAQLYPKMYNFNVPATGLSIDQVRAFVHWKKEQLYLEGLNFDFDVNISTYSEINNLDLCKAELPLPVRDKTPDWIINKEEYLKFWEVIADSTLRECIYKEVLNDEHANTLLNIENNYYLDYSGLEYVVVDPSDRLVNRLTFPFDPSVKTRKYEKDVSCQICFDSLGRLNEMNYRYFYRNCKQSEPKTGALKIVSKSVMLPNPNSMICKSLEESITHYLSYDQALAFYNWKYPIWKFNSSSKWTDYVFPSETEFEKVRKGESVYLPFENIPFPSQLFYYTVRIYE